MTEMKVVRDYDEIKKFTEVFTEIGCVAGGDKDKDQEVLIWIDNTSCGIRAQISLTTQETRNLIRALEEKVYICELCNAK